MTHALLTSPSLRPTHAYECAEVSPRHTKVEKLGFYFDEKQFGVSVIPGQHSPF